MKSDMTQGLGERQAAALQMGGQGSLQEVTRGWD